MFIFLMNSSSKIYFSYEKINTEPNDNYKKDKPLYNDYKYNPNKNNHIKKEYKTNKSIENNNSNIIIHNYLEKKNSFSYNIKQDNLLLKKSNKILNKSLNVFDNSLILNNNKKYILKNEKSPLINKTKNNDNDNSFNISITNGFKINNILNNKNRNNKLKTKFENLLDLALKNYDDNKKNIKKLDNKVEIRNMAKLEMIIDKIRNKNRKEIFKKQMELNILCKRSLNNNNIEQIKEKLNKKLFEQNLYKSINYKNNDCSKNKRNKSFKNSFIYLNDIKYSNNTLKKNNSFNLILKTQNIYRPNSKLDYNKKIIENEKNEMYCSRNEMKFKTKIKFLRTDLSFF